ncbi:MAG: winged helix-turn-helix domain-containing protein [Thermoleophilia bacterium]|nr:winged helix-turn-helix domain-containing protein [Thermoleophilia bacterium]
MASPSGLEFLVLGPLEVREGGSTVELGPRKERAVLAALLFARGGVATRERLIDELWGEQPPASADKSVQISVSNLRKRLGEGVIATRGNGYALELAPEAVDARRFEALAADGRRLLAAGNAVAARERLAAALAFWRGPALADLAEEPFLAGESARLEELRLAAIEDRTEAELALGNHEPVVAELGRLVREHPLRERLRGQLMLALYRSGRQAEALAAYRDAARTLREELGLEPSPALRQLERSILEHAPDLDRGAGAAVRDAESRPRVTRARVAVAAVAVLGAAAGAAAWLTTPWAGSSAGASVPANAVALVHPRTNAVAGHVRLGGAPGAIAVGDDAAWVANLQNEVVARIDPRTRAVTRTYPVGGRAEAVVAGPGAVWVGSASRDEVVRIDHRRDRRTRIRVGTRGSLPCSSAELPSLQTRFRIPLPVADLVLADGAVWFVCATHALARVDPDAGEATLVDYAGRLPVAIAYGAGSLWVANLDGDTVAEVDPASGETRATITAPGRAAWRSRGGRCG